MPTNTKAITLPILPELYIGIPFSPQVALADNISEAATIIPVTDVNAFPDAPSYATIGTDEEGETIFYAAKTDTALSGCVRGIEGTAKTWQAGETIARNFTNKDYLNLIENIKKHWHTTSQIVRGDSTLEDVLANIEKKLEEGVVTDRSIANVPSQFGTIVYDGKAHTPTWNSFDPSALLISGTREATEAGTYEVLFTPKQGYYWAADGTSDTIVVTWTIQRQTVEAVVQTNELTYTGEEQRPTWEGIQADIMTVSGDQAGTQAGGYVMTIILNDNYQLPDGSVGSIDFPWTIARAEIEAVPSVTNTMTYTGEEQSPAWSGYVPAQMEMEGDTAATDAGSYATRFTPDKNHQWPDGSTDTKEIAWAIAKAAGSLALSVSSLNLNVANMTQTITVTRPGNGSISAVSSNTGVVAVSVSGNVITATGKGAGSATITVSVGEGTNYTAPGSKAVSVTASVPSANLESNDWNTIRDVASSGNAANYWSVGDTKTVQLNGKVGNFTFSNTSIQAFIIGFDHNNAREGAKSIHFLMGKISGTDVALCDSGYNVEQTSAGYFHMNTSRTNVGGWKGSAMRTLLGNNGTPASPAANTMLAALPSALRSVMKGVSKYTDNAGGGVDNASNVTVTVDYLFLLAEFEVFGARSYANSGEQNYQQQYAYFKAGNAKIAYNHTAVTTAVWWFLRSPTYYNSSNFCNVYGSGNANSNTASWSGGLRFGFCVSAA